MVGFLEIGTRRKSLLNIMTHTILTVPNQIKADKKI